MSEPNNNEDKREETEVHEENKETPIDVTYTPHENKEETTTPKQPREPKKNHPAATIVVSSVLAIVLGLGSGYFASTRLANGNVTVRYTTEASPSQSSNGSTNDTMTVSDVANTASQSVVEITTKSQGVSYGIYGGIYTSTAAGSGVIISSDGYIITNNHVVEDANTISVTTYDGQSYNATLVGTDEKSDIAVIKIDANNLTAATIGDSSQISAGDTAIVIGNPLGTLGGTVTSGIISSPSRELVINNESMELIQTDAAINSGNSGGGLFDGNGNLIGIVNAKDSGTTSSGATIEGIGFAIPINNAMNVAQQLMQYGKVTNRATLGVYLQTITQQTGNLEPGVYVSGIISGSGAEAAGLQQYDEIVAADGTQVSSYSDLTSVLRKKNVGDTITLTIKRNGQTQDIDVTLTGDLNTTTNTSSSTIIGGR